MNQLQMRCLFGPACLLLALPAIALGSSATALKRYETGKYESALREYKRLLLEKPDEPRLHFNAGAAAYQVNDFEEALKQLNAALTAQDLQLQERTYYNLGNTEYRLGADAQAPDKKKASWEQAIANYESALTLNPKDEDARFNQELVKKKLEELKQQEQQQKQDQQSKEDQKKDDKDQSKQDQQKDQQKKQDEQSKSEQQDKKDKPEQSKPQPNQKQEDSKGGAEKRSEPAGERETGRRLAKGKGIQGEQPGRLSGAGSQGDGAPNDARTSAETARRSEVR